MFVFHKGRKTYITSKFISTQEEDENVKKRRKILFLPTSTEKKHNNVEWLNVLINSVMQRFVFPHSGDFKQRILDSLNKEVPLPDFLVRLNAMALVHTCKINLIIFFKFIGATQGNVNFSHFELGSKAPVLRTISCVEDKDGIVCCYKLSCCH